MKATPPKLESRKMFFHLSQKERIVCFAIKEEKKNGFTFNYAHFQTARDYFLVLNGEKMMHQGHWGGISNK